MARQGTVLLVLGGVLAVAVGLAVWAATGDSTLTDDASAKSATPADAPADEDAAKTQSSGRRAKRAGTASVVGEVRRSKGKVPVAGQTVELLPERGDAWTAVTDAK